MQRDQPFTTDLPDRLACDVAAVRPSPVLRRLVLPAALGIASVAPRAGVAQFLDPDNKILCWRCNSHDSHFAGAIGLTPHVDRPDQLFPAVRQLFEFLATDRPLIAVFPGLAISYAVLAFNLFGDGLRDILDPRLADK